MAIILIRLYMYVLCTASATAFVVIFVVLLVVVVDVACFKSFQTALCGRVFTMCVSAHWGLNWLAEGATKQII